MTERTPFTATILGSPRIGPNRELKRAVEKYWAGNLERAELESVAAKLRRDTWEALAAAGLDSVPVNTFSYYDQMLDTAVLVGALPARVSAVADDLDRYFAAARGNDEIAPLEMTKWFDTNYHYIVPEIGPDTRFALNADKVLGEWEEARALGIPARPVIVGPITFLALSKPVDGADAPIDRLADLVVVYGELLQTLAEHGVEWVQIDEPVLVTDIVENAAELASRTYELLGRPANRPAIFVATYFGSLDGALPALARTPVEAIGVDLVAGGVSAVAAVPELADKLLVAGVVDGRNIWAHQSGGGAEHAGHAVWVRPRAVAVSTSCSTMHVPYSLGPESDLDDALRSWLAFGDEKVAEVATLARALRDGRDSIEAAIKTSTDAAASRGSDPRLHNEQMRAKLDRGARLRRPSRPRAGPAREPERPACICPSCPRRRSARIPQTSAIRKARAALRSGDIDQAEYERRMRAEIADVIKLQEELGIDVLVHGEPERNDMVQYFAEQLDGFFATAERLGAVLRHPVRAPTDPVRRRRPAAAP